MELEVVAFIFGGILLAVGVLGGGFQVKELNVPKVGRVARFFSGLLGGFFMLVSIGLANPEPPNPSPIAPAPISPGPNDDPTPPLTSYSAENTHAYWMTWKRFNNQIAEPFNLYNETYSIENSQNLSQLYTSLANALAEVSVAEVDSELIEIASNATVLYRKRSTLYQKQANILSRYVQFQQQNNSSDKALEAIIRGILTEDLLIVPREMAAEQKQFEGEWQDNENALEQVNDGVIELASKRDSLRLRLASKYMLNFESF